MSATKLVKTNSRYLELVGLVPLRPIRTESELDRAIAMVDSLLGRGELDPDEHDYLDVLTDLIEKYESAEEPLPSVDEADMLRHLIEARDVTQTEVAAATKIAESTISAILRGKRGLSRNHVVALARYFRVSPAVFLP